MAALGETHQKSHAQRVIRTNKEREIDMADYRNFDDAQAQINRFNDDVYWLKRIRSALAYLTRTETVRKAF